MSSTHGRGLLHLAAAVDQPRAGRPTLFDADPYVEAARLAESGGLDFVTLGDSFASPGPDALGVLARVAPATARIGLVATVATVATAHTEPCHVPAALATLDRVSDGRAGWQFDLSATEAEPRLFGRRRAVADDEERRQTGEDADVAARLGDGGESGAELRSDGLWGDGRRAAELRGAGLRAAELRGDGLRGDGPRAAGLRGDGLRGDGRRAFELRDAGPRDAELRDVVAGGHAERGKPYGVDDFEGTPFSVKGPSGAPQPPRGHPVRVVDATAARARQLAARYADVVLVRAVSAAQAGAVRDELRVAAKDLGRDPDELRVLASLVVDLGGGEHAAEPGHGGGGPRPSAHGPLYRGGPVDLAELITAWHTSGVVDGFHLVPAEPRRDLERLVNGTVALLQHRSLFRTFYPGRTLREHLGLARSANPYAGPVLTAGDVS
ncbi:LLM class flavin-dependent oxidoreductase [Streptomyces graminilatus]|uniref:LLM class flavin-dependent oxidoreductase n=1 Tax=Streptomyces graminilatus TaxID=1464070 RepID=UPI0006E24663|nr:LLM class flavin-dependent oxidoreductase [Streptomyces graminilatus]